MLSGQFRINGRLGIECCSEAAWKPALTVVQSDRGNVHAALLQSGQERRQERRFSGTVRPDNRPPPRGALEPADQAGRVFTG